MTGMLINGAIVPVPGVKVIGPHEEAWSFLSAGDGIARTVWPTQIILHKTKADDAERVVPGVGPLDRCRRVAADWAGDPNHSGAQVVIDSYELACLADLVTFEAWHGNQANLRSIGIEHCEELGGLIYQAVIDNSMAALPVICETVGIQMQCPRLGTYHGGPLARFVDGGTTLCGIFGHRDVTTRRGRWDPGDALFDALERRCGAEMFDFAHDEDRDIWYPRQQQLARNHDLGPIDGIPGPKTTAALRAEGYRGGVWALGKA